MNRSGLLSTFLRLRKREIAFSVFVLFLYTLVLFIHKRVFSGNFPELDTGTPLSVFPFFVVGIVSGIVLPISFSSFLCIPVSLVVTLLFGGGAYSLFLSVLSYAFGVYVSRYCDSRRNIVLMSLLGAAFHSFVSVVAWLFFRGEVGSTAVVAFSAAAVFPGLGILFLSLFVAEEFLLLTTRVKLNELCSETFPLLARLKEEAPGTYFHSRNVAFLAERAARAVGADEYMCRAGGLFHDVGKLWNPSFYTENQVGYPNVHEEVSREVSCSIIVTHIAEGVKRARRARLGFEIERFIETHHGDGPIYFYGCIEGSGGIGRYPGPVPGTREEAIVMLADALEAIARSSDGPIDGPEARGMVEFVVERAKRDRQLDESGLSDSDLESVKRAFSEVLMGIYHQRVRYDGSDSYSWRYRDGETLRQKGEKGLEGGYEETEGDGEPGSGDTKFH